MAACLYTLSDNQIAACFGRGYCLIVRAHLPRGQRTVLVYQLDKRQVWLSIEELDDLCMLRSGLYNFPEFFQIRVPCFRNYEVSSKDVPRAFTNFFQRFDCLRWGEAR